jgi:hypothetical protein
MSYRAEPSRLRDAVVRAGGVVPEPPPGRDGEFLAHVANAIIARLGTIASGEKLLRDPQKLLAVRELHGKTEVGEMEAAGVVDGCRRGAVPWLVIRGISDFGDELKDDRFHHFASCAAAAVLHDFIAHGLDLGGGLHCEAIDVQFANTAAARSAAVIRTSTRSLSRSRPATINPFVFGRAIDRDEDFVGRDDERRWLREAIDKRQPVQLLGERLMGKTSLLRWVERTVLLDRPVIWFDPSRGVTPASMVRAIACALGRPEAAASLDRPEATADHAGKVLDALVPFVLLVDDADALCSRGHGFEDGFFEAMRTLVQNGKLTWVSASRRNLYDLFNFRGLTSRFLNDAKKIWVGSLAMSAAVELAARGPNAEVVAKIVDTAGRFAYGLQWLGDFIHRRPGQLDHARDAFADDMASTFRSWWDGVDAYDKQLVKRCLAGPVVVAELDARSRRRLRGMKDRGLVAEHDGRIFVEGESWRGFVADAG